MTRRKTTPAVPADAQRSAAGQGRRRLGGGDRTVTPLYHQMYLVLREKIRDGEFPSDKPLPGEHQLAEQFSVSRVTVRRTLEQLELEGLVSRRRGVGTFPTRQPAEIGDRFNIGGAGDPSLSAGTRAEATTLGIEEIPVPSHLAARLGPDAGSVVRIQKRRSLGPGRIFTLMTAYIPRQYASLLTRQQMQNVPVPAALEAAGLDLRRAEQSVTACAADELSAALLEVPVGSPLISMSTVFADRQDRPLAVLEALYRPDLYEYRLSMLRQGDGKRWRLIQ